MIFSFFVVNLNKPSSSLGVFEIVTSFPSLPSSFLCLLVYHRSFHDATVQVPLRPVILSLGRFQCYVTFYELYLSSSLGCSFTINGQRLYAASSLKVMKISNRCCWLYLTGLNFLSSWPLLFGIFVKAITRRPNVRMMLAWKRLSAVERELRLTTDHVTGPEKRKERLDHK